MHECALNVLDKTLSDIDRNIISDALSKCCSKWPYGGVTNREMNITLRYLKANEQFEYNDDSGLIVKDFVNRNGQNDTYILLVTGYFTVLEKGDIIESGVSINDTVYSSWKLMRSK